MVKPYDDMLRVLILIEFGKMIKLVWAVCSNVCWCYLNGSTPENAHIAARNDTGRLFLVVLISIGFNQVTNEASVLSGSKLVDNSKIYHSDANYNLKI
jgi:hypothetical protein